MTPQREKYLASISGKERTIRSAIRMVEYRLKEAKEWWTRHVNYKPKKIGGYKRVVKREKLTLMACKRELAKLKGMDNVVVPRNYREWNASITGYLATCKCGRDVSWERYCPNCGKRILWEKVISNAKTSESSFCVATSNGNGNISEGKNNALTQTHQKVEQRSHGRVGG